MTNRCVILPADYDDPPAGYTTVFLDTDSHGYAFDDHAEYHNWECSRMLTLSDGDLYRVTLAVNA